MAPAGGIAKQILARRAATPEVASRILGIVKDYEEYVHMFGAEMRQGNPSPGPCGGGNPAAQADHHHIQRDHAEGRRGKPQPYAQRSPGAGTYADARPARENPAARIC